MSFTTQDKEARKFETDPADSSKVVVKTKVENTDSDAVPVKIINTDANIDVEVSVPSTISIDDSTPIDVNVTTNPVNVNSTIQGTPSVTVANSSLDTNATIQGTANVNVTNSNINAYNYVHDGAQWRFRLGDANGKAINLSHTYYTASEVTALGSSSDINLWLSAYNDGMLKKEYVASYDDEHEEDIYYQHPSLTSGNCLRLIKQYSTENSQKVLQSVFAKIDTWSYDDEISGSVGISAGTITSPDPNSTIAQHTVVTTLTITDNTVGPITLSLSGTNASLYHIHEVETGTHSQSSLTYVAGRTYQVHAHSNFAGSDYSHSITVTATGTLFNVSASVNIATSGTMTAGSSYTNTYYAAGNSNANMKLYADFNLSHDWTISWWVYANAFSNLTYLNAFFPITSFFTSSYSDEIFGTYYPKGLYMTERNNYSGSHPNYFGFSSGSSLCGWYKNADRTYTSGFHNVILTWDSTYYDSSSISQADVLAGFKIYYDNVDIGSDGNVGSSISPSDCIYTGIQFGTHTASRQSNQYASGRLDNVAIWTNHHVTTTERGLIYNSGTPADLTDTTGLTAPSKYWTMEDSSDLAKDLISNSNAGVASNWTRTAH